MRFPIQYALAYPARLPNDFPRLDLASIGQLSFAAIDIARYPCLRLALQAGKKGGTYPAVLSAADEVAVDLFLAGRLGFLDIPVLVEKVLEAHVAIPRPDLDAIIAADAWARATALSAASNIS